MCSTAAFSIRPWPCASARAAPVTPGQEYVSAALLRSGDPLLPDYFDRLIPSLERTVEGLRRGSEPERLHYYETALRELREMRELYDNGC